MYFNVLSIWFFMAFIITYVLAAGELNSACTKTQDCRIHAYYCGQTRTCQCLKDYVPNNQKNMCLGLVGAKCQYDTNCIDGAFCGSLTTCQCKDNVVPSPTKTCSSPVVPVVAADSIRLTPQQFLLLPVAIILYMKF